MNGVVHLSLPTDCAVSMAQIRNRPLFQNGFAVPAKWFHPAGFSARFAGFLGRIGLSRGVGLPFSTHAARLMSPRIQRAATTKNNAPSIVVTAVDSRE